jgi:hypothetical protein
MAIKDKEHIVGILTSTLRSYHENFPEEDMELFGLDESERDSVHDEFPVFIRSMTEHIADEIFTTKEERQEFFDKIVEGYR